MEVRVWHSFSCNNSSSYRLVAQFADASTAADAVRELTTFLGEHAQQQDDLHRNEQFDAVTEAARALGAKYGFEWEDSLWWGDTEQAGDEPLVVRHGTTLVLYHSYCSGFGEDLPEYFKARGAQLEGPTRLAPSISVLFRRPDTDAGDALARELSAIFGQDAEYISDWTIKPPWSGAAQVDGSVEAAIGFFDDGTTVAFHLPIDPRHITPLRRYLSDHDVVDPTITLCVESNVKKFWTIAGATCSSCGASLTYVDPREHGIPTEQLACSKCGGMFELSTLPDHSN